MSIDSLDPGDLRGGCHSPLLPQAAAPGPAPARGGASDLLPDSRGLPVSPAGREEPALPTLGPTLALYSAAFELS